MSKLARLDKDIYMIVNPTHCKIEVMYVRWKHCMLSRASVASVTNEQILSRLSVLILKHNARCICSQEEYTLVTIIIHVIRLNKLHWYIVLWTAEKKNSLMKLCRTGNVTRDKAIGIHNKFQECLMLYHMSKGKLIFSSRTLHSPSFTSMAHRFDSGFACLWYCSVYNWYIPVNAALPEIGIWHARNL